MYEGIGASVRRVEDPRLLRGRTAAINCIQLPQRNRQLGAGEHLVRPLQLSVSPALLVGQNVVPSEIEGEGCEERRA